MIALLVPLLLATATIPPGARVCVLGDSYTYKGQLPLALEAVMTHRHSANPPTFFYRGYGGYSAKSAVPHVQDCLFEHPDFVIVEYGANDVGATWSQAAQDATVLGFDQVLDALLAGGLTLDDVAFLGPPAVEKTYANAGPHNDDILRVTVALQTWAQTRGVLLIDLGQPLLTLFTSTATRAWRWTIDGQHPGMEGAFAIAAPVLRALHEDAGISDATIDAAAGTGACSQCALSNLIGNGSTTLDFDRIDDATPFVIPPASKNSADGLQIGNAREAVGLVPGWSDLTKWGLTVTGLATGTWRVLEDGVPAGAFTSAQLAAGIDLARRPVDATTWTPADLQTASVIGRTKLRTLPNGEWERIQLHGWIAGSLTEWTAPVGSASTAFLFLPQADWDAVAPQREALIHAVDVAADAWVAGFQARARATTHHWALRKP